MKIIQNLLISEIPIITLRIEQNKSPGIIVGELVNYIMLLLQLFFVDRVIIGHRHMGM